MKRAGAIIVVATAAVLALASCATAQRSVGRNDPAAAPSAAALLRSISLPHGAVHLSASPDSLLTSAGTRPGCSPSTDIAEWASVPGMSPAETVAWLTAHSPASLSLSGTGSEEQSGVVQSLMLSGQWAGSYPKLRSAPETAESVVPAAGGSAVRIDVMTVPKGAACVSAGGVAS